MKREPLGNGLKILPKLRLMRRVVTWMRLSCGGDRMAASVERSKRLVIDASVARAAGGEDADSPTAKYCRDFLKAVLSICHHVVMTPEISEEWKQHQSRFTSQWRVSMEARKKVERIESALNRRFREKIEQALLG